MRNVIERGIVGIIMLVFVAITIFLGQRALFVLTLFLSIAGLFELNRVLALWEMKAIPAFSIAFGVLVLLGFYFHETKLVIGAFSFLLIAVGVFTVTHPAIHAKNAIGSIFAVVYLFIPFGMLLDMPNSIYVYLVWIAAWGTDTFAYIFGMLFGKHKLIPSVSPKKTVEGAVGGTLSCVALSVLLLNRMGAKNLLPAATMMLMASVLSQFGDLFASKIKRESGIKDYGEIFLGHGGVLDRFDSMLFVIPFLYTMSRWLNLLGW